MQKSLRIFLIFHLLAIAGCASVITPVYPPDASANGRSLQSCTEHFNRLDAAIDAAGVRDGAEARMENFPYLRITRFLASFADLNLGEDIQFQTWVSALRELDVAAREAEISNFPLAPGAAMLAMSKREIRARTSECAAQMMAADINDSAKRAAMIAAAQVPNDYAIFKRALGLYPLAKYPFFHGVQAWQRDAAMAFHQSASAPAVAKRIVRYVPANMMQSENIISTFQFANRNTLGMPALSEAEWQRLFEKHAPVYDIETAAEDDRIGSLEWRVGNEGSLAQDRPPIVNIERPTAYRRIAYTRIGMKTFTQLIYTVWFPSRARRQPIDLLSGALDAVMWRVTLDDDGTPLIYDSIHACGCYHLFFPTARMQPKAAPEANIEWAFVPQVMPSVEASHRVKLRLDAVSHYIVGVGVESSPATHEGFSPVVYQWRDDEELRKLAVGGNDPRNDTRSIFQPSGIIAGTERGERFFFWPMGIESPGAMRQWGRHATAFVGIRHFDDADLLDRRFTLDPPTIVNKR